MLANPEGWPAPSGLIPWLASHPMGIRCGLDLPRSTTALENV